MKTYKQFLQNILTEAPLSELEYSVDRGKDKEVYTSYKKGGEVQTKKPEATKKPRSFKRTDQILLTRPKNIKKLIEVLAPIKQDLNLYFLDFKGSANFHERGELPSMLKYYASIAKDKPNGAEANLIRALQNQNIVNNDFEFTDKAKKSITILYSTNRGDKAVGLTPWIILHRLGHAINVFRGGGKRYFEEMFYDELCYEIYNFLSNNYGFDDERFGKYINNLRRKGYSADKEEIMYDFLSQFGNFNSARMTQKYKEGGSGLKKSNKAVVAKNRYYELVYDLFVAFLYYKTNAENVWDDNEPAVLPFKFKTTNLPKKIKIGRFTVETDEDTLDIQGGDMYKNMIDNLNTKVNKLFDQLNGKVFIM